MNSSNFNIDNSVKTRRFSMIEGSKSQVESKEKVTASDWRLFTTFRKDEYVEAMVEDLCDWFNFLYNIENENKMTTSTFFQQIENGVILNKHAKTVQTLAEEYLRNTQNNTRNLPLKIGNKIMKVPNAPPTYVNVDFTRKINKFHKRDNISNFIQWCRNFNIPASLTFETEDLIALKNPRNVVVCLLEVARIGRLFGMEVPDIIQLEEEIEKEISDETYDHKIEESGISNHNSFPKEETVQLNCLENINNNNNFTSKLRKPTTSRKNTLNTSSIESQEELFNGSHVENGLDDNKSNVLESSGHNPFFNKWDNITHKVDNSDNESIISNGSQYVIPKFKPFRPVGRVKIYDCFDQTNNVKSRKYREVCDMRSLDERVREILSECQCEETFPMKRISEGRYQWGDKKILIFVRILRNHVMVRVGGGWDTLNDFLRKHDHCRKERNDSGFLRTLALPLNKPLKSSSSCHADLKNSCQTITIKETTNEEPIICLRKQKVCDRRRSMIPTYDSIDNTTAIVSISYQNASENKSSTDVQSSYTPMEDDIFKNSENKENKSSDSLNQQYNQTGDIKSSTLTNIEILSKTVDNADIKPNQIKERRMSRIPVLKR